MTTASDDDVPAEVDVERGRSSFRFVLEHFPVLAEVLPAPSALAPFSYEEGMVGRSNGCCTHPTILQRGWFGERSLSGAEGCRKFYRARDQLPDTFFAAGTRCSSSTEHVVVMWKADHRLLYFQCKYLSGYGRDGDAYDGARASLDACLREWWGGEQFVLWCDRKIWPPIGPDSSSGTSKG